jgi:hypothetical protein
MACMGPSDKLAKKQAREAYKEVRKLLKERYGVVENNEPITYTSDGTSITVTLPTFSQDRKIAEKKLREALEELFWIQACEDF